MPILSIVPLLIIVGMVLLQKHFLDSDQRREAITTHC